MDRNWIFFQRKYANEQTSIFLDLHLTKHSTPAKLPYLLTLFINIYHIADNAEQAKRIQKELSEIEEKLEEKLSVTGLGIFVGRIDSTTRLEYLFYVQDTDLARDSVLEQLESYPSYRHRVQVREDPNWDFYTYLTPSVEEQRCAWNAQIIRSLEHEGYRVGIAQRVHHHLRFMCKKDLDTAKVCLIHEGYRVEQVEQDPLGACYMYVLQVSRVLLLNEEALNETTKQMYDMITRTHGKYEGWGMTPQVKAARKWKHFMGKLKLPLILTCVVVLLGGIGIFIH